MNAHVLMVLYTGIVFVSAGACLLEVCRLLGKSYENKPSAHIGWRGLHFIAAVIFFGYGVMVLFPGEALRVQHMSIGLPLVGSVVIGFALAYLDHVMGEREPPKWTVQMVRVLALMGMEGLSRRAAFMLPPAPIDAAPPTEGPGPRAQRIAVIGSAITLIGVIAGTILINATA
jgi:drug/metabolite transporter (DMT)-like permease